MLSSSKIEEVLQNSCAFKLTVRQTDRQAGKAGKVDNKIDSYTTTTTTLHYTTATTTNTNILRYTTIH